MDVASIKGKSFADTSTGNKNGGSAEQILVDFSAAVAERMKKSGSLSAEKTGKNGLVSHLTAKADIQAEPQPEPKAEPQAQAARDNDDDGAPAHRHDDSAGVERAEAPAPRDDAPRQEAAPRETAHDDRSDTAPSDTPNEANGEEQAASGETAQGDSANDGDANQTGEQPSGEENVAAAAAAGTQQQAATANAAQVLAGVAGKTETGQVKAADANGKPTMQKGVENAQAAVGGQKTQNAAGEQKAADGGNDLGGDVAARDTSKSKATPAQAQNAANTHLKADQGADRGATVAQQQAADLSKKVGTNQPMNVNVNVTKQSEELVSQPTANLAGTTTAKGEGESLTPTSVQASTKGQAAQAATHNLGGQAGQNGADAQAQNQQQAQFQAAQAEAAKAVANGAEAKAQAAQSTSTAGQAVKVGGAEGAAPTQAANPTTNANPAQHTAAPAKQAHNPNAQARAQVTEQVTVQINKALNDGMDKIRIQLKPAHLGRVDVQLEMTQEGRVTAVISADNKDTLDLLKQDSRELERALREAGLDLNSGDLSFNMRGENGQEQEVADNKSGPSAPIQEPTLEELLDAQPMRRDIISEDRVDITA